MHLWCIIDLVINAQNDWRDVGRPQVAMHRNWHIFSLYLFYAKTKKIEFLFDQNYKNIVAQRNYEGLSYRAQVCIDVTAGILPIKNTKKKC